jgi:hypothetical protein
MKNFFKGMVAAAGLALVFAACGPSHKVTSSWKNPSFTAQGQYQKVFVSALVQNQSLKQNLENYMAAAVRSKGYQVVKSTDIFQPTFTKANAPSNEDVLNKIREAGCDLIYTISLVDKQSETRYVPGSTYAPFPGYGMGFRGYYGYWAPYAYDPGYYTTDKTYFFEGSLFDSKSETLIWSVQTEAYNPSSIEKLSEGLTATMLEQAQKDLNMKR